MNWLGLHLNTVDMMVSIPLEKMQDMLWPVVEWGTKSSANVQQLLALLRKLLHIVQCCSSTRLFLHRMLATLRECPETGNIALTSEFHKDLQWFKRYAACHSRVSMMTEDMRQPIHIYMDACTTGCSMMCQAVAYHAISPQHVLKEGIPICELEALNAVVATKLWAPTLAVHRVILHSDSAMAVEIIQAGKGRDSRSHPGICQRGMAGLCHTLCHTHVCTHMVIT